MITIAPRSSSTASAVRKTFSPVGTRLPSSASIPSANAMSVAHGIAQPCSATGSALFSEAWMTAGPAIPPSAASVGSIMRARLFSCPTVSSRLSSMPTSRKKMAMRKSLTNRTSVSSFPGTGTGSASTRWYVSAQLPLAISSAAAAQATRSTPFVASCRRSRGSRRMT